MFLICNKQDRDTETDRDTQTDIDTQTETDTLTERDSDKEEGLEKLRLEIFYGCNIISSKIGLHQNFSQTFFGREFFMVPKSFPGEQREREKEADGKRQRG